VRLRRGIQSGEMDREKQEDKSGRENKGEKKTVSASD
jgi:hypothetical protein